LPGAATMNGAASFDPVIRRRAAVDDAKAAVSTVQPAAKGEQERLCVQTEPGRFRATGGFPPT